MSLTPFSLIAPGWPGVIGHVKKAGPSYDADTIAWAAAVVAAGGAVSSGRKSLVDALITGLKSDGVWSLLDRIWIPAEDSYGSLIDLKARGVATNSGASFTPSVGFTGDGSSAVIDTNFNASTAGGNYQAANASAFVWNYTNSTNYLFGNAGDANTQLLGLTGATEYRADINSSADALHGYGRTNLLGLLAASRFSSSSSASYQNGSVVTTSSTSVTPVLFNSNFLILRTINSFGSGQVGPFGFGASLSGTLQTNLYNRLYTYMHAIGAA